MDNVFCFKNAVGEEATDRDYVFAQNSAENVVLKGAEGSGLRKFEGTAYTGDAIRRHPFWGTVVFDLDGMNVPSKMPILLNHNGDSIVGHSDFSEKSFEKGLLIRGVLSKNEESGRRVAALSDEGFPWQMSVRISPSRIDEVLAGSSVFVNGREVQGPAYIFRESTLSETSFTPTGWDAGTSATALSRSQTPTVEDTQMSKEMQDRITELEAKLTEANTAFANATEQIKTLTAELSTAKSTIEGNAAAARVEKLKTAYSNAGIEFPDTMKPIVESMTDAAADAFAQTFATIKKPEARPEGLFSHVAHDGKAPATLPAHESNLLAICDEQAKSFAQR